MKAASLLALATLFTTSTASAQAIMDETVTFERLDRDQNGHIEPAEWNRALVARTHVRFERLDGNQDRGLDATEYAAAEREADAFRDKLPWIVRRRLPSAPAFADLDTNGDGKITAQEMIDGTQARRTQSFDRADDNEDGTISAAEFEQMQTKLRKLRSMSK